jgi:iron complex transport system permease protein
VVYRLGAMGRSGATPVRLALAGTAVSAALIAAVQAVTLLDTQAFDAYRRWVLGSLAGREEAVSGQVAPFILAGLAVGLLLPRALNAIALGDDASRALGANVQRTRLAGFAAITLLCGAATAAAGPIVFLGLAVPHMVRALTGPDQRWVLPLTLVVAPILLLTADVIGRVIDPPGEIAVGVVCAFLGGPVFIALVRGRRVPQL